jgi:hypothetical protein
MHLYICVSMCVLTSSSSSSSSSFVRQLFANEDMIHGSYGQSSSSHYQSVSNWTKKARSSASNTDNDSAKRSWLDSLRKDVTSKAATSRSRHSSQDNNHASSSAKGLAGAWMVLNEHTFGDMEDMQQRHGSRVTDALVSPTRRRLHSNTNGK